MRQDQYEKLQALEEKLADIFLDEADPAKWSGAGLEPHAMDAQSRGDRYWCKRNAVATVALLQRVGQLIGYVQGQPPEGGGDRLVPPNGDDMDEEVRSAEKEASKLMAKIGKAARAHGGA